MGRVFDIRKKRFLKAGEISETLRRIAARGPRGRRAPGVFDVRTGRFLSDQQVLQRRIAQLVKKGGEELRKLNPSEKVRLKELKETTAKIPKITRITTVSASVAGAPITRKELSEAQKGKILDRNVLELEQELKGLESEKQRLLQQEKTIAGKDITAASKFNLDVKKFNEKIKAFNQRGETIKLDVQAFNRELQRKAAAGEITLIGGEKITRLPKKPTELLETGIAREVEAKRPIVGVQPIEDIIPSITKRTKETLLGFGELGAGLAATSIKGFQALGVPTKPKPEVVRRLGRAAGFVSGAAIALPEAVLFQTFGRVIGLGEEVGARIVGKKPIPTELIFTGVSEKIVLGAQQVPILGDIFGAKQAVTRAGKVALTREALTEFASAVTFLSLPALPRAKVKKVPSKILSPAAVGIQDIFARVKGKLAFKKPTLAQAFEAETLTLKQFKRDFFRGAKPITPSERKEFFRLLTGQQVQKRVKVFGKPRIDIQAILKKEFPFPGDVPRVRVRTFDVPKRGLTGKQRKEFERLVQEIGVARGERVFRKFFRTTVERPTGVELRELQAALRPPTRVVAKAIRGERFLEFTPKEARAALLEDLGLAVRIRERKLVSSKKFAEEIKRGAARLLKKEEESLKKLGAEEKGTIRGFQEVVGQLQQIQRKKRRRLRRIFEEEEIIFPELFPAVPEAVKRPRAEALTFERFGAVSGAALRATQAQRLREIQAGVTVQLLRARERPALSEIAALRELTGFATIQTLKERELLRSRFAQLTSLTEVQTLKQLQSLKEAEAQRLKEIQRTRTQTIERITPKLVTVPKVAALKTIPKVPFLILPLPEVDAPQFQAPTDDPQKGFNVFIRRKGKLTRRNKVPLTRPSAFGLGFLLADQSVARSGVVRDAKKKGKSIPALNRVTAIAFKFRKPKGKTKLARDSFVERSRFAIDSIGELEGITAKGRAQAERNRSIRKVLRLPPKRRKKTKRRKRK